MDRNPDINDEEVGASTFKMKKEQAVERMTAKIRHHLGRDWLRLREDEIELLEMLLGECWAFFDFARWDQINISAITFDRIENILETGRAMTRGKKSPHSCYLEIGELLRAL